MAVQIGALSHQTRRWIWCPPRWEYLVFLKESYHHRWWGRWNPRSSDALGLGAQVTILDISAKRLSDLEDVFDRKSKPMSIHLTLKGPVSVMPMLSSEPSYPLG